MLWQTHPEDAERFLQQSQAEVRQRYHHYKQLAELEWDDSVSVAASKLKLNTQQASTTEKDA